MSTYLYGVIRRSGARSKLSPDVLGTGVGDPPASVELVLHGDLAAVTSDVDPDTLGDNAGARALRRDMAAHSQVLARVLDRVTVLPARFGVVFPDPTALVAGFLRPTHAQLMNQLDRLHGTVELSVRAELVEQKAIEQIARESPQLLERLRRSNVRASGARYHERIELGRQIALRIGARRDQEARWLADRLSTKALDIRASEPQSDLTAFRGSVLVGRKDLVQFDRLLEEIVQEAGSRMKVACVGPLPPYSFVDLHVPASGSSSRQRTRQGDGD